MAGYLLMLMAAVLVTALAALDFTRVALALETLAKVLFILVPIIFMVSSVIGFARRGRV